MDVPFTINFIKQAAESDTDLPPVLLIHGLMEDHTGWNNIAIHLRQKQEVILLDLPGHGENRHLSNAPDVTELAQKIGETLSEQGYSETGIIGFSFGGRIAYLIASLFPDLVKFLVIEDIGYLPKKISPKFLFNADTGSHRNIQSDPRNNGETFNKQMISGLLQEISERDFSPCIESIQCPTLIIRAGRSREFSQEESLSMRNLLPNSELITVDDCFHAVHREKAEAFLAIISDFIYTT